jgi:anion-transporting  ArsA/GET3 family ATPase
VSLGSQRILIVTGKGGVGKTTVSVALALEAARRGLRTVVAETSGSQRIAPLFGQESRGYDLVELAPNLHTLSITPLEAMEDYIVQQVKIRRIYEMVFRNRVMGPFVDAVPGLHDAVQLGKVFDLEREQRFGRRRWDLIVVDAPATGHGLSLLSSARTMMDLTRAGPLYEGVKLVHDVVDDPERTGVVLVSLPEEMPVNETAELYQRLGSDSQRRVRLVALNQMAAPPFPAGDDWPRAREALLAAGDPALAEAASLTDRWLERLDRQAAARATLRRRIPRPLIELPRCSSGAPDRAALHDLGALLGGAMDAA